MYKPHEAVFSPNLKDAQERLFQMIYEEDYIKGEKVIKSRENKNGIEYIETEDRKIEAAPALLNRKAMKCTTAHVDKEISVNMLEELVLPCLYSNYKTKSIWESVKFFKTKDYKESNNPFFFS